MRKAGLCKKGFAERVGLDLDCGGWIELRKSGKRCQGKKQHGLGHWGRNNGTGIHKPGRLGCSKELGTESYIVGKNIER